MAQPMISIAIIGIALGLAVMILSMAIVTGFKFQISEKVIGFGSHIQILNFDSNQSFETVPIEKDQLFVNDLQNLRGIKNIQPFAIKAGIIKTREDIQGVVLKGVDSTYDWSFFRKNLKAGKLPSFDEKSKSTDILISKYFADLLKLTPGDKIFTVFVDDPPRYRPFIISGIYETSLDDFDERFALVDIRQIQSLSNWESNQISGFEINIEDFSKLDEYTRTVNDIVGFNFNPDGSKLKVLNIRQKYVQIFDWLNLIDLNVIVILILMVTVAGINMISGLLIIILDRVNMIGILKALGARNWNIRKIFLIQSGYLIIKGLFWGNLIGIAVAILQQKFKIIQLDPTSYYLDAVPVNLKFLHIIGLNAGTLAIIIGMLIIPSYIISRISPEKTIRFN